MSTINFGCLIILIADSCDSGQINDHAVAEIFPEVKENDQEYPHHRLIVDIDRTCAEPGQQRI
ncbi:hypothetical protein D3C75_1015880 [compost metagenome]